MSLRRQAEFPLLAAGIAPLAAHTADPVQAALLGLVLLVSLPVAAGILYSLRPLVPAALILPLIPATSCACCYAATLLLKLAWYPAGIIMSTPLALAGGCSAVVLTGTLMVRQTHLGEMLRGACIAGGVCLALLLGVGVLHALMAWMGAGYSPPGTWLLMTDTPAPSAWSALLILGVLLGAATRCRRTT